MRREPREVWEKRVERWLASGQTAKEFARASGINVWTLRSWRTKLGMEGPVGSSAVSARRTRAHGKPTQAVAGGALPFVEVLASAALSSELERFEIELPGGSTVRVPCRFDPEMLRRVLAVVEGR